MRNHQYKISEIQAFVGFTLNLKKVQKGSLNLSPDNNFSIVTILINRTKPSTKGLNLFLKG